MDLSVSRSQGDGRDVLCVSDARTEQEAGRYDRRSGRLVVADQARVYEVVQALWDFLAVAADVAAEAGAATATDVGRACPPGVDEPRPEARDAFEAAGAPEARVVSGAREVPGISDDFDAWASPGASGPAPAPTTGAKGKGGRLVDRRLGRLRRDGWAVLSPGGGRLGADFDRLVIGPPGVFAITVAHASDAPVRSPGVRRANDGLSEGRHDAESAARMLSAASGMMIKVTPMLAYVGADADAVDARARPDGHGTPGGVLVARGEDIAEVLWGLPAVYSIQERKQIFDVARQAGLWRAA